MTEKPHYKQWYGRQRWRLRALRQLDREPLCCMCETAGVLREATVADHINPHRGDPTLFWYGRLQSLCAAHHSRDKQVIEERGFGLEIGADGWPVDRNHPVYRGAEIENA